MNALNCSFHGSVFTPNPPDDDDDEEEEDDEPSPGRDGDFHDDD